MVQTTEENVTLYFYTIFLKLQLFHTKILIGQLFCNDHIKFEAQFMEICGEDNS